MKNDTAASRDAELTRFQKLARALFGVDKKDIPKHEPKKRRKPEAKAEASDRTA